MFPRMGQLKKLREDAKLSMSELAEKAGVTKSTVAAYEREKHLNIQFVRYLLAIKKALKLSPKKFVEILERLVGHP